MGSARKQPIPDPIAATDRAIDKMPEMRQFLQQALNERASFKGLWPDYISARLPPLLRNSSNRWIITVNGWHRLEAGGTRTGKGGQAALCPGPCNYNYKESKRRDKEFL